jgi:putative heme-binding domain-containing protein
VDRKTFLPTVLAALTLLVCYRVSRGADAPPQRAAWTTSRVVGSPEPPPPYRLERTFPKLKFASPVDMTWGPATLNRWFVVEQYGKILSFPPDMAVATADVAIDLKKDLIGLDKVPTARSVSNVYALAFHPDFERNPYAYVCYVLDVPVPGPSADIGSRIARFTVKADGGVPKLDPASEVVMVEWRAGGHNGCCLKFGHDGYLYISTGDAADPNPPDKYNTGQNINDLLCSILRIDVDHAEGGKHYAIPKDNPFVKTPGARGEVYAYGLRNPWRMGVDRATGDFWVADVGWELWESVVRLVPGGNYGWSIMEGPQPVRSDVPRGPTPLIPPALAVPHSDSCSITGGTVYRGTQRPDLAGHYVFGDWETRRVWASKVEAGGKLAPYKLIAESDIRVVNFAEDAGGELYILGYDDGGIHRIVPNDARGAGSFPRKLSETGLFADVARHLPAPGVVPFEVNAAQWNDGATAERWIAVPGSGGVGWNDNKLAFPAGTVLTRTFRLEGVPVETQLLMFDGRRWNGYTYKWNEQRTDAELVPAGGATATFSFADHAEASENQSPSPGNPGEGGGEGSSERSAKTPSPQPSPGVPGEGEGRRQGERVWQFPSRAQCATCHNSFADFTLAYNPMQLDRQVGDSTANNQLDRLRAMNLFPATAPRPPKHLADPYGTAGTVEERARSYLHVNCSHCHRFGGGGSALIDLRYDIPERDRHTIGQRPNLGTFELDDAHVITPGEPARSVMMYRMSKTGRGRMPHIGSQVVDHDGVLLIERWVRQMPHGPRAVSEAGPSLQTTSGALQLALDVERGQVKGEAKERLVKEALASPKEAVRDLFERFAPPGSLAGRLGPVVDAAKLLAMAGDVGRGRQVFYGAGGVAAEAGGLCSQCHRIGNDGQTFGPDLSHVGTKYDKRLLLENILEPSKTIDPKFMTYVCRTKKGQDYSGILVEQTAERVVLRDAQKHDAAIPADDVARLVPQPVSAMPEGLLGSLTPQQAADLLEFLAAQK